MPNINAINTSEELVHSTSKQGGVITGIEDLYREKDYTLLQGPNIIYQTQLKLVITLSWPMEGGSSTNLHMHMHVTLLTY